MNPALFNFQNMQQTQFIAAINQLCEEKNLPRETVLETIKAALRAAYRKDYGNREQNVDVDINESTGQATVYLIKEVVKKVEIEDQQMSLKEALKYKKEPKVGDIIKIDVTPLEYGRIAAQSAKQVIIQRLQEAERDLMYDTFKDRENELISALVHRVEGQNVYIDLGKITTNLMLEHQIQGERYYGGQRLKLYLDKVIKTTKGPQLLISRTHPNLVKKLLELEIPEIKSGIVEIKGIAREPGVRSKVAVISSDEKIDPIGSCVGQKGVRIKNVMEELNGERIDVIKWEENPEQYLRAALAPAKTGYIKLDDQEKRALVYVEPEQRPLAIGKNGQNVRLASHLTGWEVDILDISELGESKEAKEAAAKEAGKEEAKKVSELGLAPELAAKLESANLTLVSQLKGLSAKDLQSVEGIDEKGATEIAEAVKKSE